MQIIVDAFDPRRLPVEDAEQVRSYLLDAALVKCAVGQYPDEIDPAKRRRVDGWVTDGVLVWPQAVAYYVAEHRLAPPAPLLARIRAQGYRCPRVSPDEAHRVQQRLRRRRG